MKTEHLAMALYLVDHLRAPIRESAEIFRAFYDAAREMERKEEMEAKRDFEMALHSMKAKEPHG